MDEERKDNLTETPGDTETPSEEQAEGKLPEESPAEEAEVTEEDLDRKDAGGSFADRYQRVKERDIQKLSAEIEDQDAENKKHKRRNWWIKTILLLLLIGLSIGLLFTITSVLSDEKVTFGEMIRGVKPIHILTVLAAIVVYMFFESMKYCYLLKISTGKFRFRVGIKTMFLGKYYDGITPLGTGGQPFQIYYLHKKQIPAGVATAVPLAKYIVTTFVYCACAVVFFALSPMLLPGDVATTTILIISWVSMFFNVLVPVTILIISAFPRGGKKFIIKLITLLKKMRIVKRKYPTIRKYLYEVDEYRHSLKAIFRRWYMIIPLVLLCMLTLVASYSVPFAVALFVGGDAVTPTWTLYAQILCLGCLSFYSSSLFPTPGNSGATEAASALVFVTLSDAISPIAGWLVLVWRFCTYYIYILSGIGINIFEIIRGAVRNRRARKKGM